MARWSETAAGSESTARLETEASRKPRERSWSEASYRSRHSNSPGSVGDGMLVWNGQRKSGTALGWPRHSRTAEAPRITRNAVKSRCNRERGAWGRVSDDGSGQHNLNRSEDPWGRWWSYRVDRSDFGRINAVGASPTSGGVQPPPRTEKSRQRRSLLSLQELMRRVRHDRIGDQVSEINAALRGPLRLLRRRGEYPRVVQGVLGHGALRAQDSV
jgi:hypothetical protein